MNGRYENGALPEKVRLLYEAVLAMVTDGWDINRMKVSDITAQAGDRQRNSVRVFFLQGGDHCECGPLRCGDAVCARTGNHQRRGRFCRKICTDSYLYGRGVREAAGVLSSGTDRNWFVWRSLSPCAGNVKRDSRLWSPSGG